jgi:hypothetical protein
VLVEEVPHVLAKGLALFLLHHSQVHVSTRSTHSAREVAVNYPIECLSSDSSHVSGAWSRQKGK